MSTFPFFHDLKEGCEARDLSEELLDEDEEMDLDEEEEARAMDLLTRYNKILNKEFCNRGRGLSAAI